MARKMIPLRQKFLFIPIDEHLPINDKLDDIGYFKINREVVKAIDNVAEAISDSLR